MAVNVRVANNAFGQLASSVSTSDTTISLEIGNAERFPTLTGSQYFYATMANSANQLEIVKVTAVDADNFTVLRAQDGTTAKEFDAGDRIELRPVAALFEDYIEGAIEEVQDSLGTMSTQDSDSVNITGGTASLSSLTGTAVTQSATDTTAGRLMKVGDFGLGGSAVGSESQDRTLITETGVYAVTSGADAPRAQNNQTLLHISRNTARGYQFNFQTDSSLNGFNIDVRKKVGTSVSAWHRLYNSTNILGTVSQSGGVPTGAIIERDINANGEYVKFADGTLIEWVRISEDLPSAINSPGDFVRYDFSVHIPPVSLSWTRAQISSLHGRALGGGGNRAPIQLTGRLNEVVIFYRVVTNEGTNTDGSTPCQHFRVDLAKISTWF